MDFWDYKRPRAQLSLGPLGAQVDIEYPQQGLHNVRLSGEPLAGLKLLGVEVPGQPVTGPEAILEDYSRGHDLVATYAQSPTRTVRPQLYWRAVSLALGAGAALGVELIFSMQTSLLESAPRADVTCDLPGGAIWQLIDADTGQFEEVTESAKLPNRGCGLFVFQPAQGEWSLATMAGRGDFVAARLGSGGLAEAVSQASMPAMRLAYELFPESLEKGVIRRARLLSVFLPGSGENAQASALECYGKFTAEALPLST